MSVLVHLLRYVAALQRRTIIIGFDPFSSKPNLDTPLSFASIRKGLFESDNEGGTNPSRAAPPVFVFIGVWLARLFGLAVWRFAGRNSRRKPKQFPGLVTENIPFSCLRKWFILSRYCWGVLFKTRIERSVQSRSLAFH